MSSKNVAISVLLLFTVLFVCVDCQHKPVDIARLTVLVSGDTEGYLKNCGCSGGQVGGEKRKSRMIQIERQDASQGKPTDKDRPVEVVAIDIGNFVNGSSEVYRLYSSGVVKSMELIGYDMVGLGHDELTYGQADLWDLLKGSKFPLTSANVTFTKPGEGEDMSADLNGLVEPYRVITKESGYRIGFIHVVDTGLGPMNAAKYGVELTSASDAIKEIMENHGNEADLWIASIASSSANGTSAAKVAANEDVTLMVGFRGNNPLEDETSTKVRYPFFINGPFSKAKSVMKAVVHFSKADPSRRVIEASQMLLNSNIEADSKVSDLIDELEPKLRDLEEEMTERLLQNQDPPPHYIGQQECAMCHEGIYNQLLETRHMHAYESLFEKEVHESAACLPCHVTGHGTTSGWNIFDNQPEFQNVTCESCHGPGSYHAEAMGLMLAGGDFELPDDFSADGRNPAGLQDPGRDTCIKCHDQLNSVSFRFDTYWPKIAHSSEGTEKE